MKKGQALYQKAKALIPGGTQLLSKRPEMFLPEGWPAYYATSKGCRVTDLDGTQYIEATIMSAGTNILGYANDVVDAAVKQAIDEGNMSTLNAPEEVLLAEVLCDLHPWAEKVRYAKAGGEAMAVATRIARAYTRKDIVLVCGYHGWSDWYLAANLIEGDPLANVHLKGLEPAGVPQGLAGSTLIFHYNHIDEFHALIKAHEGQIAAVIMEPIRNEYPKDGFLETIRETTKKQGIVLIYDEISAGFRLCNGGSHKVLDVNPDMAVFSKAMGNGYPIAAIIGHGSVMTAAEDSFISSTFWTERIGFCAALATIQFCKEHNVQAYLQEIGQRVQEGWAEAAKECNLVMDIGGIYPMSHFSIPGQEAMAAKTYFTQEMLKKGYLASPAFYMSFAHTHVIVDEYLKACKEVFAALSSILGRAEEVGRYLEGPVCHAGFQRLN